MLDVNIFEALNKGDAFSAVALYLRMIEREWRMSVKYQLVLFQKGVAIKK